MDQITISKLTNSVYKNEFSFLGMDINIPDEVKNLYFIDNASGWIEYFDKPNENITELPQWAVDAVAVFDALYEDTFNNPDQPVYDGLETL